MSQNTTRFKGKIPHGLFPITMVNNLLNGQGVRIDSQVHYANIIYFHFSKQHKLENHLKAKFLAPFQNECFHLKHF